MNEGLDNLCISPTDTLRTVMERIDRAARGIALVVDEHRHLVATVTDGDVRRAILGGLRLDEPVSRLLPQRGAAGHRAPVTASPQMAPEQLRRLMDQHKVRHLPLVDAENRVVDLVTSDRLDGREALPVRAVIMAGGFGRRLDPLTRDTPKPMLPVGDRPLIELTVEQLRASGIEQVHISTHYLADRIKRHFGDGEGFGVSVSYLSESRPLGTAGALGLLDAPSEPLLVINGDILTRVDYKQMLGFHREQGAALTVAVRQYGMEVPYGVVQCDGERVIDVQEKPTVNFLVNAGIYLLEPTVLELIPPDRRFDMPELIRAAGHDGRRVVSFPVVEYWLDVGRFDDYRQAQVAVAEGAQRWPAARHQPKAG